MCVVRSPIRGAHPADHRLHEERQSSGIHDGRRRSSSPFDTTDLRVKYNHDAGASEPPHVLPVLVLPVLRVSPYLHPSYPGHEERPHTRPFGYRSPVADFRIPDQRTTEQPGANGRRNRDDVVAAAGDIFQSGPG
jgi:hypothetical protein